MAVKLVGNVSAWLLVKERLDIGKHKYSLTDINLHAQSLAYEVEAYDAVEMITCSQSVPHHSLTFRKHQLANLHGWQQHFVHSVRSVECIVRYGETDGFCAFDGCFLEDSCLAGTCVEHEAVSLSIDAYRQGNMSILEVDGYRVDEVFP